MIADSHGLRATGKRLLAALLQYPACSIQRAVYAVHQAACFFNVCASQCELQCRNVCNVQFDQHVACSCGSWEGPLYASERAGGPTRLLGSPSSRLVWGGAEKSRGEGPIRTLPRLQRSAFARFRSRSRIRILSYALVLGLAHVLKCVCIERASVLVCVLVLVPRPRRFLFEFRKGIDVGGGVPCAL
jgi:hypothetical protein